MSTNGIEPIFQTNLCNFLAASGDCAEATNNKGFLEYIFSLLTVTSNIMTPLNLQLELLQARCKRSK
jgi:hypothetical protein